MKILFLDIDGVMNDHTKHPNGYSGMQSGPIENLNFLLKTMPDLQIVITSAWRYVSPDPKVHAFILCIHGANAYGRVEDVTVSDEEIENGPMPACDEIEEWRRKGLIWRVKQIKKWLKEHGNPDYVVVDDLPLKVDNLVQTDPKIGLTKENVSEIEHNFWEQRNRPW